MGRDRGRADLSVGAVAPTGSYITTRRRNGPYGVQPRARGLSSAPAVETWERPEAVG